MRRALAILAAAAAGFVIQAASPSPALADHQCQRKDVGPAPVIIYNIHVHHVDCGLARKLGTRAVRYTNAHLADHYFSFRWHAFQCSGFRHNTYYDTYRCKRNRQPDRTWRQRVRFELSYP